MDDVSDKIQQKVSSLFKCRCYTVRVCTSSRAITPKNLSRAAFPAAYSPQLEKAWTANNEETLTMTVLCSG